MIEIINQEPTTEEKIQRLAKHYGRAEQIEKAKEELVELLAELEAAQTINGTVVLPDNTWSEVADVEIMCRQLAIQHGTKARVREQVEYKLNRKLKRIKNENRIA